jgi:hypothetical protein
MFFVTGILSGIVREALVKTFDAGVTVRNVTFDGTGHNISAMKALGKLSYIFSIMPRFINSPHCLLTGANLQPTSMEDIKVKQYMFVRVFPHKNLTIFQISIEHPHSECNSKVYLYPDPVHMIKNVRNLLADFKVLIWPGVGKIVWELVEQLQELQDKHGLRLGNKVFLHY